MYDVRELTWLFMDCVVGGGVRGLLTLPLGLKAMAWGGSLWGQKLSENTPCSS